MKSVNSMLKSKFLLLVTGLLLSVVSVGVFAPPQLVDAASANRPLAMVYYGWHDSTTDARIINAQPSILIDNTPAGYWHGNSDVATFQSQGIDVYSYIDASYGARPLWDNYTLISAIAAEGSYGIFVDQASPSATAYNQSIYSYAKSMGLSVILNPGMPYVDAGIYSVADYVMTDEHYQGRLPTAVEAAYLNQTIVIGFGDWTATQAAMYTNAALANGFEYSWHEQAEYNYLPTWLEEYVSLLTTAVVTTSLTGDTTATVAGAPSFSGATNQYNLNVTITTTTVDGLTAGQTVWVAASTTDFPNLGTAGSIIRGNLNNSLGWWVLE